MDKVGLNPWERIAWSTAYEQIIYRDWGVFYTHSQQLDKAAHYYNKSLEIKDDDEKALYYRSQCKRDVAMPHHALKDAVLASEIYPSSAPIKLEICDALYEMNQFERAKVELHQNARGFQGKKVEAFLDRLIVIDGNLKDSIGETLGPFILKHQNIFKMVLDTIDRANYRDERPLWKILKDQHKCDVVSILEKEEVLLSPREIARRERCFKVFNQIYLNKSWIDVIFLKNLRDNEQLLLPQCRVSTPQLRRLVISKYDIVKKFLKMLQARSPLYNEHKVRCPNKEVWERHREAHLNRIQYRTRRNMITILRSVKQYRAEGRVKKLAKYVEEVMGDYVVLKTYRIMPWKFEFINEVYNTLALAYADQYFIPSDMMNLPPKNRKLALLGVATDTNKDRGINFVFGDKYTYLDADKSDHDLLFYKKFQTRLEKRLRFAKFSIERCYILYEMAQSHLEHNHLDECCLVARKAAEESNVCKNIVWKFLAAMMIVKAHAVLHKIERCKEALDRAARIVVHLKNPAISNFIEVCKSINEEELVLKKRSQSLDSMRKRRSRLSLTSHISDAGGSSAVKIAGQTKEDSNEEINVEPSVHTLAGS